MPQCRPHAREQFAHPERLADVVVRASVERNNLILLLAPCRKDDDRHSGPLAEAPDHLESVDIGQTKIEDDDVRLPGGRFTKTILSRGRLEQAVPLTDQGGAEKAPYLRFVLDQHDGWAACLLRCGLLRYCH